MKQFTVCLTAEMIVGEFINNAAVPIFVVDAQHTVIIWNRACEELTGVPAAEVLGTDGHWKPFYDRERPGLADLVIDGREAEMDALYSVCSRSSLIPGGLQAEGWYRNLGGRDRYLCFTAAPVRNSQGELVAAIETFQDTTEGKRAEEELRAERELVQHANAELKATQVQLLQREKMASIGQLAAGVAHEINNPIGFVSSNLSTLDKYVTKMFEYIACQEEKLRSIARPEILRELEEKKGGLKLDYVMEDARNLIRESLEGTDRVRKIVQDLKTFSRLDEAEFKRADINECLESTINIVWNEIKYKSILRKELGDLPPIKCYPQQLTQVFLNLLVNASHALDSQGEITLRSWSDAGFIHVSVADTGCGIPEETQRRIFEPFFTTKEVGKGTGLGLSISYDIVKKHNGDIKVQSTVGKGTTFTVRLPVVT
ncbi:MAG: PAS domain-containing protein [Deltaproteobacteria bacterium]|nr:PAS domain-containing protein [Deltaproteobacteria bacterium]